MEIELRDPVDRQIIVRIGIARQGLAGVRAPALVATGVPRHLGDPRDLRVERHITVIPELAAESLPELRLPWFGLAEPMRGSGTIGVFPVTAAGLRGRMRRLLPRSTRHGATISANPRSLNCQTFE